jgi:hypothetical protein
VEDVPAGDFRRMTTGALAWGIPTPRPAASQIHKYAKMLRELSFQDKECRLCCQELDDQESPEVAQIWKLLEGRFVAPFINHELKTGQRELGFRRMHILCSLWEDELAKVQLALTDVTATDEELAMQLTDAIPKVLELARKRRPGMMEEDVFRALDVVLALWEAEENNG